MILRNTKILLLLAVAAWAGIASFFNILFWGETLSSVSAVTSMVTIEGGADHWQAVQSPLVSWLGAIFITGSKLLAGGLIIIGSLRMWGARAAPAVDFNRAKSIALAGCGIAIFMLVAGFIVIAETFFELWRSEAMRGPALGSAFRYAGLIGLIAIFVAQPDE